jgi:hypothetical protein
MHGSHWFFWVGFLAVICFELKALYLLVRHSYHLNHTVNPFCFNYFLR